MNWILHFCFRISDCVIVQLVMDRVGVDAHFVVVVVVVVYAEGIIYIFNLSMCYKRDEYVNISNNHKTENKNIDDENDLKSDDAFSRRHSF